jgi:probable phosphoglycerate mutase
MKLYVARHGQSNYNVLFLCNADPTVDVHLTDLGNSQANKLAKELKEAPIELIYVSQLRRTKQTADIINKYHDVKIVVDPRLNDNKSGFEGKHVSEYLEALSLTDNPTEIRLNDGESLQDVVDRVQSFLDDLKKKQYETVLIVTSQIIVQYIDGIIKKIPNVVSYGLDIDKGSYIELEL